MENYTEEHDILIKDEGDFHIVKLLTNKAIKTSVGSGFTYSGKQLSFGVNSEQVPNVRNWCEKQNLTYQEF